MILREWTVHLVDDNKSINIVFEDGDKEIIASNIYCSVSHIDYNIEA